jgi:hypothetical protein
MQAGRIVLLVLGVILVLTSVGLLIGGGVLMALENTFKDSDGFYSTNKIEVNSKAAAIVSVPADININGGWFRTHNLATVKVEATNIDPDKAVFIGIARTSAIDRYLDGISYAEANDYSYNGDTLRLHTHSGDASAPVPTSQTIWSASVNGTGTQTLEWDITSGHYTIVLMNADGTSPIDADVRLGVKIPFVLNAVGVGLLVGGIILLVGGGVMIFFGAWRR